MLKSVIASVLCAAVAVAASGHNVECTPVISGQLQLWEYNSTSSPMPLGVNSTKSGEYVTDVTGKGHTPLDVVYESCSDGAYVAYTHVLLEKDRELCVARRNNTTPKTLVLERCSNSNREVYKKQDFIAYYGAGLKGQNATLFSYAMGGNGGEYMSPFVGLVKANVTYEGKKELLPVVGMIGARAVLQIGNPKVHNAHK